MSDDQDIRAMLDEDFESVQKDLTNGSGGNPAVHGRALSLLLKHVRILVRRKTVTETECQERMAKCAAVVTTPSTCATVITHLVKDLPPWLIIGGYFVAKANGWIE